MHDLYIANLPYELNEPEIKTLFEPYGDVHKVTLILDHATGRKKGYGFVKIQSQEISEAIEALHLSQCMGRTIKVKLTPSR